MRRSKSNRSRRIGQLAAELGVTSKTIRYYEAVGLLPAVRRSPSGYRQYTEADCDRLHFIIRAKNLELTLHEIADILSVCDRGEPPCAPLALLLDQKIAAVDQQARRLRTLRRELTRIRKAALGKNCALGKLLGKVSRSARPQISRTRACA